MTSVIEFCCGYGGATKGMLDAGLTIEKAYDIWPVAVEQHHQWLPDVPCEVRDVATVTPEELAGRFVWASLPCQPYSMANIRRDKRGKNHPHYYSLAHFARQVQHARAALIENVPGLVWSKEGRAELNELEAECIRLGLTMTVHLVYSHWFGVEQWRRRAFILIGRNLPLILIQPGSGLIPDQNHTSVMATEGGVNGSLRRRMHASVTCHDGGDNVHSSRKKRLLAAAPLASEGKGRSGEVATAGIGRTVAENARLQGVPTPSTSLTKEDQYTLVGNAVPPRLARAIAEQVFVPLLSQGVSA